mmetsp:Transcript_32199/g.37836  ORF Transcript_32199/g.37836 Transcript_32199/m.37836 type:complete len:663 (-) Transcript_32199:31-2019(-)|eukprot:CAMPEP_0114341528 /NCGR_PEP_ID=MMETSP0101-20121206/9109_1 /TAXON_ID=38822 ORGANISM="Pteridomonas danica, Strain PT" /NCGR_SAMPLE_ID=MMETSP0101 /ASSEMBLY_ACC=CAM_ASM_000211 /LENGTH=662 /DNA_ID=CAMNT_0001475165 /DNA_START=150 /DNA_END=2138 /DNA_ORIENTATION=-
MPKLLAKGLSANEYDAALNLTSKTEEDVELGSTTARLSSTMGITATNSVNITFENISFSIEVGTKKEPKTKEVLKNLSGELKSGTMTAIMGPTGSGKTSLLNVLAYRMPVNKKATLTGSLLLNGHAIDSPLWLRKFARLSAYVMQEDVMNAFLTVRETLDLAATFQLPPSISKEKRSELVSSVISELGLNKVADTMLGSARVRGVSGGEKKRANIGIELIKNPSMLFLDEPTSGLDSFQAQSVMTCIGGLAKNGRTVVASIHQPRSSIFALFDQLYLISEGRTMFAGQAVQAVKYFAELDKRFECPSLFNPADWFLDITSADYRSDDKEVDSLNRIKILGDHWETKLQSQILPSGKLSPSVVSLNVDEEEIPTYQSSVPKQIQLIMWRSGAAVFRDKSTVLSKIIPSLFFALVIGGIYSDVSKDQKGIQDLIGALFFFTINQTFGNMFAVLQTFSEEKVVVERERASKSYRLSSFYLGKVSAELPLNLISPAVFGCAVYWMVGLNSKPERFFYFIIILLEIGFAAVGLGMFVASVAPNEQAATASAPVIVVLMILFGGFYINVESLPDAVSWIQYLSIMRWGFMGFVVNEFQGETFSCHGVDVDAGEACVKTGEEQISRLSFKGETVGGAIFGLFCMIVGFNVLAYIVLRLNKRKYAKIEAV